MTVCTGGQLTCSGGAGPNVYFAEDFKNNSKGWTLDTGWGIGSATASSGQNFGFPDPAMDHTPTADNGIAGAYIGGNVPITANPPKYLLSPVINMTGKAGPIVLTYYRVLNSDYPGYMDSTLEVKNAAGTWVVLFSVPQFTPISEQSWLKYTHDVSAHAANNPNFQMRWGWSTTGSALTYTVSGWNVDDVSLANAACP